MDTQGHKKTEQESAEDRVEKERVLKTERMTLCAVEWTAYATIALVFVGLFGTIAAIRTLGQIKRQADLMAVPYRSWVHYGKWESSCRSFADGSFKFVVSFAVANRTQSPITLKDALVTFSPEGFEPNTFGFGPECRLLPGREKVGNMSWDITSTNFSGWESGQLSYKGKIIGDLNHVGPLGACPDDERRFYGTLCCSKQITRFEEETLVPADKQQNKAK